MPCCGLCDLVVCVHRDLVVRIHRVPASVHALLEPGDECFGRGWVGGKGHVVNVTDANEGADVGFVRLRGQRVTKENHGQHLALCHQRTNLLIPAQRPRQHAGDWQARVFHQYAARGSRGDQAKPGQCLLMLERKARQVVFFLIVGDQRDDVRHNSDYRAAARR